MCNHLFIDEIFFWLEGKANQNQPLNLKNRSQPFIAILKTKQRTMDHWIKKIDYGTKKDGLLGERVFNFQIGHLPSTITIRSLKIKCIFFFFFLF